MNLFKRIKRSIENKKERKELLERRANLVANIELNLYCLKGKDLDGGEHTECMRIENYEIMDEIRAIDTRLRELA